MFTLVYTHHGRTHRHELKAGDTIVGRALTCDIVLDASSISRRHARFRMANDHRCIVTDLGGRNTTCVNRQVVNEVEVKPGDIVELGHVVLRVEASVAPPVLLNDQHTILESPDTVIRRVDEPAPPSAEPQRLVSLLSEISRRLVRWQPLPEILERVVALVFDMVPVERAFLMLIDERTGDIVPHVARSRSGQALDRATLSRTIIRSALDERVATLAADVWLDPRLANVGSVHAALIRSFMCAPLWNQNEVIGVLYVDNPYKAHLSSGDLDVLQALSSYAAVAIEQARLTARLVEETRQRERLQRYHSTAVVNRILHSGGDDAALVAEERDVTILFADIVGFTTISERLSPSEVAALLNRCFAEMCEAVFQEDGTLDKFIGDAVLAVFGAPLAQPDHALRGLRAAARMRRVIAALDCDPPIVLRIALNSGVATVGDIGSPKRREYTALGDVVNTCSRLVSSACAPGQIVLSGATRARLGDAVPLHPLGEVSIRGRQGLVELFELASDVVVG